MKQTLWLRDADLLYQLEINTCPSSLSMAIFAGAALISVSPPLAGKENQPHFYLTPNKI